MVGKSVVIFGRYGVELESFRKVESRRASLFFKGRLSVDLHVDVRSSSVDDLFSSNRLELSPTLE